jgi:hypothetical protein
MTCKELAEWVRATKKLEEQVIIALQEDDDPDEIIDGFQVCLLPFTAHTTPKHSRIIKENPWPDEPISHLHIFLWKDEKVRLPEIPYTWQNLIDWVETLEDQNIEAIALAAWHGCNLRTLPSGMLYAYEVD